MLVYLHGGFRYTFKDKCSGQKVIASGQFRGLVQVRYSELVRVGLIDPENYKIEDMSDTLSFRFNRDCTKVKPKLQNCTDLSIGKGWEGYYDQKPIKKSNFR